MTAPADTWVDEIAVERALHGKRVGRQLTHAECLEVARRLAAHGHGASALSKLLRCNGTKARVIFQEATA